MADSKIEWTDRVWNPVRGCSIVSAGCKNCYAMKQAHRFSGAGGAYEGLTQLSKNGPAWTGRARFVPEKLAEPLSWKKPARVFVNSMSDLFHEDVSFDDIDRVFAIMALCAHHTFQVLTKRPERMRAYFADRDLYSVQETEEWRRAADRVDGDDDPNGTRAHHALTALLERAVVGAKWPLKNVWLGVSAENQKTADERLPLLLQTPAAVRFASMEPLLGRVMFAWRLKSSPVDAPEGITWDRGLDWVIVGGESGPGARPCAIEWLEFAVQQCEWHDVPIFVKQLGAYVVSEGRVDHEREGDERWAWRAGLKDRKGGDPGEWPEHLNVRQFPEVRRG